MKKTTRIVLILIIMSLLVTACGSNIDRKEGDGRLKVVTTIFPQYDFVRQIAGDRVDMKMLIAPGAETHSYEPSPQDIIDIENSDLFIYVGGESDSWIEKILEDMDKDRGEIMSLMDVVSLLEEELSEGMEDTEASHDHEEEEYDDHAWTSPVNAMEISREIAARLMDLDEGNADFYRENLAGYLEELGDLDRSFRELVEGGNHKPLIFADRFPFLYFAREYGLEYFGAFPGCSAETEASPTTLKFLIDKVREEKIGHVFYIEFSNEKMADIINESTGSKKLLFHSGHNLSKDEFESGLGYLDIMKGNLSNLREAMEYESN